MNMRLRLFFSVLAFYSVGCSPYAVPLKQSYISRSQDFLRVTAPRGTPINNLQFIQFVRSDITSEERRLVESVPAHRAVKDSLGHRYEATPRGLRICSPLTARERNTSLKVNIIRFIARVCDVVAEPLGNDAFARAIAGDDEGLVMKGGDGLPVEQLTIIALAPASSDIVMGSERGVVLFSQGAFYYFAGNRWLDDDAVAHVLLDKNNNILVQTRSGFVKIERAKLTLVQKESRYRAMLSRHRCHGLTMSIRNGYNAPGDNDGLWTALTAAAESFRYAVTRDNDARLSAKESIDALMLLERITDTPGFFARTAVADDDHVHGVDTHTPRWHASKTCPGWRWKGDTSFDELVGHLFAYSIYYDLVANQQEKEEIRTMVNRIIDRLMEHQFNLTDENSATTHWGRGDPSYTRTDIREFVGRGPLSLGTLAVVKIAAHITRRQDIETLYRELVTEYGYAFNMYNAKIILPGLINHSDDELAFLSYYNLVRLEENPDLKRLYLISLDRYWHIERPERNSLWDFMYCALSGNTCDIDQALQTLREFPLDLRNWREENSRRADITDNGKDHHGNLQSKEALPYYERTVNRWNVNPYELDSGGDGDVELEPTVWLLPYWLAKWHNLF